MNETNKTIGALAEAFRLERYPISQSWIRRQEQKGNLILPRSTTNFKRVTVGLRKSGAVRLLNDEQIHDILVAFLPKGWKLNDGSTAEGTGYYNYLK